LVVVVALLIFYRVFVIVLVHLLSHHVRLCANSITLLSQAFCLIFQSAKPLN